MEQHLGRELNPLEKVHHKDGNKLNNTIENLEVMTQADHMRHHLLGAIKIAVNKSDTHRKCGRCKEIKTLEHFYVAKSTNHGYYGICKECVKIKNSEWWSTHGSKYSGK
jgi:HNH endonuclease